LDPADLLPRCTFPPPGSKVTLAVSGGADSMALLVLAVAAGCHAVAVHVDHGLRPDSDKEADVVAEATRRFGVPFQAQRAQVAAGPNLEARAREARYAALPSDVLTGHTADDQAETILLNLVRGAGLEGLAGMRPARRPLLALRRAETRELCHGVGVAWVEDPTNTSPVHRRNRIRHELIPLLDDIAERDLVPVVARQAVLLREDADLLDELAATIDVSDARALATAPRPLARRAVRRWLDRGHPPDSATVERVLAVARGETRACEIGGGRRVERHSMRLGVATDEQLGPPG
jgi:tRNA(Ile)-lysidine synthase